ncbi:hypothetical protein QVD17_26153 [Tagetes erecta]|uniref:Uncharacterized protein n=1 Tax=Tagetes erecta TaxID=13708 RepID=A0AAD8NQJ4_TARER|nr:hypothetical protein QVD17_26153 [Tagetes erecta]
MYEMNHTNMFCDIFLFISAISQTYKSSHHHHHLCHSLTIIAYLRRRSFLRPPNTYLRLSSIFTPTTFSRTACVRVYDSFSASLLI